MHFCPLLKLHSSWKFKCHSRVFSLHLYLTHWDGLPQRESLQLFVTCEQFSSEFQNYKVLFLGPCSCLVVCFPVLPSLTKEGE